MKKFVTSLAVGALGVALVLPASATASKRHLAGQVDPSGTVSMNVIKRNGKTKVVRWKAFGVPISCNEGNTTAGANTTGFIFKVHNGRFGAVLANNAETATLTVHGKLKNHNRRAVGTMRIQGSSVLTDDGQRTNCDTGTRDWHAHA